MNDKFDIFISYSRRDRELVLSVVKQLQKRGFTIWIDKDGIGNSDAFISDIVRGIKNSDVFLFFSSKASNESPWIIKEVNMAVYLKKTIIPIRLDDTDYNDSILFDLVGLDYIDFVNEEKRSIALDMLINTLLSKIVPTNSNDIERKNANTKTISNVEEFKMGSDKKMYQDKDNFKWHKDEIFISYSREDSLTVHPFVKMIQNSLNTKCWIDMDGIESGEQFEEKIIAAIERAKIVLFMISDVSIKSIWTKREVNYAESLQKKVVPVVIDNKGLRGWFSFHFGNIDYIDVNSQEQVTKLIKNLKEWLK